MILIIAEHQRGSITRATWEAVASAQVLAAGEPIGIAVLGANAPLLAELSAAGVGEVLSVEHPLLESYTSDGWVRALQQVLAQATPRLVLLPHSYQTRDFVPRLAARLDAPLVTDAVGLEGTLDALVITRPMFQGKLVARVKPVGPGPVLVSLQIGVVRAETLQRSSVAPVRSLSVALEPSDIRQRPEPPFQEAKQAVDLSQAERIVSVGRGIKTRENLAVAERLAVALRAELAASRPICDNGWLPMDRQIGSSGQTVAPRLYVALGISGAIQHLVGMKGARTIVAINKDADAPIFEVADYGIVGDLFEVVPAIVSALQQS
ncbi:MAG: electron transfer flavoprotein subunit alpha/FixB family protein [Vicinamibacterales bacterium]